MRQDFNQLVGNRDEAVTQLGEWGIETAAAEELVASAAARPLTGRHLGIPFPFKSHGNIAYVMFKDGEYRVWAEL
jgi:hypothetical protein